MIQLFVTLLMLQYIFYIDKLQYKKTNNHVRFILYSSGVVVDPAPGFTVLDV